MERGPVSCGRESERTHHKSPNGHIEIDLISHTEFLIAAGLLKSWDYDNRSAIADATARLLRTLATENETRFGATNPAGV
jgi:hypothetical protein